MRGFITRLMGLTSTSYTFIFSLKPKHARPRWTIWNISLQCKCNVGLIFRRQIYRILRIIAFVRGDHAGPVCGYPPGNPRGSQPLSEGTGSSSESVPGICRDRRQRSGPCTTVAALISILAHSKNELIQWRGVRRLSVRPSVRPSVNFCANRFLSQANGRIAAKLSQDGLQVSVHPGCAQGQGQRSRDTRTFLDSWNELLRHWRSGCYSYNKMLLVVAAIICKL